MNFSGNIPRFFSCILFQILSVGVFCPVALASEQPDSTLRDPEYLRRSEPLLESRNPAGLQVLPAKSFSELRLGLNHTQGAFVNFYQPDNSLSWQAFAGSSYRFNSRTVFQGKVSYEKFSGKNMGGSMFIDPDQNPIDIVEPNDATRGTKEMENYNFSGALSTALAPQLDVGAAIDLRATNYAKMKDLRHINSLLDMNVRMGILYKTEGQLAAGLNYMYRRRIESLDPNVYGNTSQPYINLISFGSFFGTTELFGTSGYADGNKRPLADISHGLDAQLIFSGSSGFRFLNEFSVKRRKGYYGREGLNERKLTEHTGDAFAYRAVLSLRKKAQLHSLMLNVHLDNLLNNENNYRSETLPGSVERLVLYSQTEKLDRVNTGIELAYGAYLGLRGEIPLWNLAGSLRFNNRQQTSSRFPYYRKQDINSSGFLLSAGRNIFREKDIFGISATAGYGTGGGTAREDGVYAPPSSDQRTPASADLLLNREFEYLTAARLNASVALRYSRLLDKGRKPYIEFRYCGTRASDVEYIGTRLDEFRLTVGCTL